MIQAIHSAATTLSGMLNPEKYVACLKAGMGACDRSKSDGVSGSKLSAARKGRMGCLTFTARLSRKSNCLTEIRLSAKCGPANSNSRRA